MSNFFRLYISFSLMLTCNSKIRDLKINKSEYNNSIIGKEEFDKQNFSNENLCKRVLKSRSLNCSCFALALFCLELLVDYFGEIEYFIDPKWIKSANDINDSNIFKFYILKDPFIELEDPKNCSSYPDLFVELYNHSTRTFDISEADLFLFPWSINGFNDPGCFTKKSYLNNFTYKANSKYVYYDSTIRRKLIDNEIEYFHKLKKDKIIKNKSILHFREILRENLFEEYNIHDVSYGTLAALTGGIVPGNRGHLDLTIPLQPKSLQKLKAKFSEVVIDCNLYNKTSILFFQGRNHGSWLPKEVFNFSYAYDKYDFRLKDIRNRISRHLENEKTFKKGIIINTRKRNQPKYKLELDYIYHMTHSHFCLIISGNQPWSYRFYEALITGCIPVIVSGGWQLPFTPAIDWSKIVLRIEENFNWTNTNALLDKLWGKNMTGEEHILKKIYNNDICKWHYAVRDIWDIYFENPNLWTNLFLKSMEKKIKKQLLRNNSWSS